MGLHGLRMLGIAKQDPCYRRLQLEYGALPMESRTIGPTSTVAHGEAVDGAGGVARGLAPQTLAQAKARATAVTDGQGRSFVDIC